MSLIFSYCFLAFFFPYLNLSFSLFLHFFSFSFWCSAIGSLFHLVPCQIQHSVVQKGFTEQMKEAYEVGLVRFRAIVTSCWFRVEYVATCECVDQKYVKFHSKLIKRKLQLSFLSPLIFADESLRSSQSDRILIYSLFDTTTTPRYQCI